MRRNGVLSKVVLTALEVRTTEIFLFVIRKTCGAFHANGRPHSHTLRYRVPGYFAHQVRVALKLFSVPFLSRKGTRRRLPRRASLQLLLEVPVDVYVFLDRDERVGVDGVDGAEEVFDFVFGEADHDYVEAVAGVGAGAFPVGYAAA